MFCNIEVLRVVQISIKSILNPINDSWFKINKQRSRYVMFVISLIEEDIFSIIPLCCILFQYSIRVDAVLHA